MKKLTKDQINLKDQLARRMNQVEQDVREAIRIHNQRQEETLAEVVNAINDLNELADEVNAFIQEIHDAQDEYQGERSDTWQNSEGGCAHQGWAAEWTLSLEHTHIEHPEPIEEPDMDAAEALRELPDHP